MLQVQLLAVTSHTVALNTCMCFYPLLFTNVTVVQNTGDGCFPLLHSSMELAANQQTCI